MLLRIIFVAAIFQLLYANCKTSKSNLQNGQTQPDVSDGPKYTSADTFYLLKQKLAGNWIWLKTDCCGRIKKTSTPKTTNTTIEKQFNTDGTVVVRTNGKSEGTLAYRLLFSYMNDNDTMISIDDGRAGLLRFFGDTLVIDFGYVDLQTEWYVRNRKQ
jgi:hypothetical protein